MTHTTQPASTLTAIPDGPEKLYDLRIKHSRIAEVMNELDTLIYPESQDSILLVCGPTGVGKSTLAKHMVDTALQASATRMEQDAGVIPAVYVEAPSSGERKFSWRLFYQRILHQLEGDLDMPKSEFGIDSATGRMVKPRGGAANTLGALRTAVERALRARKTGFLVIDEAAHIIRQTSRNDLEIQLDTLKSLANECGTQMVLVGSYDLYQLVSLSGQLARRTHVLHFERYQQAMETDVRAFKMCVQKFEAKLPDLWGGKLMQHAEALHENTLGCIGTLSAVLTRAAKLAHKDGSWTVDALRRALLTEAQRHQILEEILEGEAAINPSLTRTMARPRNASKRSAA
jgi:hypothetical protein